MDTDDTDSFGPEIITSYLLNDGTYRYGVHHYDGTNTLTSSEAIVNLIIDGLGIYTFTPPLEGREVNDMWIVYDLTVVNGKVTGVTPVNQIIHGVVANDIAIWSP